MANTSIYNAFERMWQHVVALLGNKQNKLTGAEGQIVGFDANGEAIAQDFTGGGSTTVLKSWTSTDV